MTTTHTVRPFRFGVVAGRAADAAAWTRVARRAEDQGFDTLLVPDRPGIVLSVVPALAAAAAVTERLRVGPYVLAAGSRTVSDVVAEMATLDLLSGGRLEVGVGAGLAPAATVTQVRALLEALRAPSPDTYPPPTKPPPLLLAAGGPRMLALAAELADTVALASRDLGESGVRGPVATLAELGVDPELLLALQTVVGPGAPPDPGTAHRLRAMFGTTVDELVAQGSPFVLAGTVPQRCDRLLRLRERYGISYVTVPEESAEAMVPVVEHLTGS
jgi:alkanesulfonate monooxygenase SsuD/methylene tetrahydromethanopterin reductase-like flavin-dependent oxidoreductase (luciferase family)